MRSLTVKLSLLFVLVSLVAVVVVALWVGQRVESEFDAYCRQACLCNLEQGHIGGTGEDLPARAATGALELAYLEAVRVSLVQAALVAGLAAIALALLFSRVITSPLKHLTASARHIRDGDFSQRVNLETGDEIGELATAFNGMVEKLEENERGRRQLLADVVHELRTPLSIIQGNLEAWQDGVVAPTPESIAPVHEEAVLLSRLITDLRDLSLAEAGQLSFSREDVDLAALASTVMASYQHRADSHAITITLDVPADTLPRADIDPIRISQVLRNLLDNAVRHTPRGGTISIGVSQVSQDFLKVDVADTGSGIAPHDLPHVFEHFYKVDPARERVRSGSGIGLAIVRQFVEAHGGLVMAHSELGLGSVFSFTVPVAAKPSIPEQ